jgi:hypothetical protein
MRCARQAVAIAAIAAIVLTGAVAPAAAATEPTRLWNEFPLDPKARDAVRARLPTMSTPPAPANASGDQMLFASGLAMLFLSVSGAAVVALSVLLLRDSYSWYRDRRYY